MLRSIVLDVADLKLYSPKAVFLLKTFKWKKSIKIQAILLGFLKSSFVFVKPTQRAHN